MLRWTLSAMIRRSQLMDSGAYLPIEKKPDLGPRPVDTKSFLPDDVHLQAVKVVIALYLLVQSNQPDLLENLHLVKMAELLKKKRDHGQILGLLQAYYKQYIATSISVEKSQAYGNLFTRLKYSVRKTETSLFEKQDFTEDKATFDTITISLSATFSLLEKVFSAEEGIAKILLSPQPTRDEEKKTSHPTGTAEEEKDLIANYYCPQILREHKKHDVVGYQTQDQMFENLDKAIFEMMKIGWDILAQNLLRHRMLLVTYLLNNKNNMEKICLAQKLAHATGDVMNTFIAYPLDAEKINEAVDVYYADCVTSNAALSADSTGNRIIKSIAAIAVGLLFCALVLCVAWLISYFWAGIVLVDISWKIQTGLAVTTACSLTLSGLFSCKKLRGEGYLDSEINQSTKTITENMRQISRDLHT